MIPAYPKTYTPTLTLNGQEYPLSEVDFIVWESGVAEGGYAGSEDDDKNYIDFVDSPEWSVVFRDNSHIDVDPDTLDPDTKEYISQVAFPT